MFIMASGNLDIESVNDATSGRMRSPLWILTLSLLVSVLVGLSLARVPVVSADPAAIDCAAQTDIPQYECAVLLDLYNATDGPNWGDAADNNWNVAATPCSWLGVTCAAGHVIGIERYAVGASGALPVSLNSLAYLEVLSLDNNNLTGAIPPELGYLSNLKTLSLFNNGLSGSIPAALGDLSNLQYLWLSGNDLSGSIPVELGNLAALKNLYLHDNALTGSIPAELGNLTALQELWLSGNSLTGSIPVELGDLAELQKLYLYKNALTGNIPVELGDLTNLDELYLVANALTGDVPFSLTQLTGLGYLGLSYNGLLADDAQVNDFISTRNPGWATKQTLPPLVVDAAVISGNSVSITWQPISHDWDGGYYQVSYSLTPGGPYVPAASTTFSITSSAYTVTELLPERTYYFVVQTHSPAHTYNSTAVTSSFSNEVSATTLLAIDCAVQTDIPQAECEALLDLYNATDGVNWSDAASNHWNVTDTPCSWTGITCAGGHVTTLDRGMKRLRGVLPATLGDLAELNILHLYHNYLTGTIPVELGNLTHLASLHLGTNELSGGIPAGLGNLLNLQAIHMYTNHLTGPIPVEFGNLVNLQELVLYDNELTGDIPVELGNLVKLTDLRLYGNHLTGPIPVEFGNLVDLESLDLHFNKLTGSVPASIGNLVKLQDLSLNFNVLTGSLPLSLTQLTGLNCSACLGLSYNGVHAADQSLVEFLNSKDPDWASTQTVPPASLTTSHIATDSLQVNWQPISYTSDGGYYQVFYSLTSGGPYSAADSTTADKTTTSYTMIGLVPGTKYYFVVQTHTPVHGLNQSPITSAYSEEVSATTLSSSLFPTDCAVQTDIPQTECEALLDLYNATDGPNWTDATSNNWNKNNGPCTWIGVTCDDGHVTGVDRSDKGLDGVLSVTLDDLVELNDLYLSDNQLTGTIPVQLGNLSDLYRLYLDNNALSGAIPAELGDLSKLYHLYLENNALSGSIPAELGQLSKLYHLHLDNNALTGTIPEELGQFSNLYHLHLHSNALQGSVPLSLTHLSVLISLDVGYNGLYADDSRVAEFLKSEDPDWANTQTVAPFVIDATSVSGTSVQVNWQPLRYSADGGHYQVLYSLTAGGPYVPAASTTLSKTIASYTVTGLSADAPYYFVVQAYTPAHANNKSAITSAYSAEVYSGSVSIYLPQMVCKFGDMTVVGR